MNDDSISSFCADTSSLRGEPTVSTSGLSNTRSQANLPRVVFFHDAKQLERLVRDSLSFGGNSHRSFGPSGPLAVHPLRLLATTLLQTLCRYDDAIPHGPPSPQPRRISISMRALSTDTLSHLRNPRRPCRMGIPVRSPGVGRRHRESGANG